jgi:hypothetical protein
MGKASTDEPVATQLAFDTQGTTTFDMKMGLTHIDATSPLCDSCL